METRNNMRVIIVGAGPAGLVAAAEFLKRAKDNPKQLFEIHIIEKRSIKDFDRRQKLINNRRAAVNLHDISTRLISEPFLDWQQYTADTFNVPSTIGLFSTDKISPEEKFVIKLARQNGDMQELVQKNLLTGEMKSQNFSIKELQNALLSHIKKESLLVANVYLHWHQESHITAINFSSNTAQIFHQGQLVSIQFDHFMNCEGGKGETRLLINKALKAIKVPEFKLEEAKIPTLKHCAVRIKLKSEHLSDELVKDLLNKQIVLNAEKFKEIIQEFKQLGFENYKTKYGDYQAPAIFIIDDNIYKQEYTKKPEFRMFVAGEIPDSLYNMPEGEEKRAKIVKWATLLASLEFKLPADYFEFDDKGETKEHQINALTFSNKIKACAESGIQLKNGTIILQIGDANQDNIYYLGFSSLLALNDSILGVKVINALLPLKKYNQITLSQKEFSFYYLQDFGLRRCKRNFAAEYKAEQQTDNDELGKLGISLRYYNK